VWLSRVHSLKSGLVAICTLLFPRAIAADAFDGERIPDYVSFL
jgi:hypothetical protein